MGNGGSPPLFEPDGVSGKQLAMKYQGPLKLALQKGDLKRAEMLLMEARHRFHAPVNHQMLNWLVHAYVKKKAPAKAGAWLERMQPEFDVKPTVRTFAHVLD